MTRPAFAIKDFMTVDPRAIEPNESLDVALKRMRELRVLHLPVRAAGKTVGVLSERDLGAVERVYLKTGNPGQLKVVKVLDVMTPDPYCVGPEAPLNEVATAMANQKIGTALVVDEGGALLGIFTVTDALKALSALS